MASKQIKGYKKRKKIKVNYKPNYQSKLILPFVLLLANKFLNIIGFVDFIDHSVEWDRKHWKVSPGNLAKAVILVTFLQIRAPLYKIEESFEGIDTEALFGKGVLPQHLNDDAIARALDRISEAKPESLFCSLCLSLYSKLEIAFKRLHSDTTTLSFAGAYEQSDNDENDDLKIVQGYNKDHRPHCKQVVVGKIVNEHGIAVASSTMNGNTSDVEWNQKALKLVKEMFGEKLNDITYIADSKLINMPTFKQLMDPQNKIKFISRCPASFHNKVASKVINQAYKDDQWMEVGTIGRGKKACTHEMREYTQSIEGHNVRLIVVKTSAGQERYERKMQKQKAELEKDILAVTKKDFACEADAKEEWERFKKAHKKSLFKYDVNFIEIKIEKRGKGNPGKNPKAPKLIINWSISANITGADDSVTEKFKHEEECFVLITSVEKTELNGPAVLQQYKGQSVVEMQFKLLKEPALTPAIFLKIPHRVDALVMLLNISLLIRALVQYKIRKSIDETEEELPRIGWDNKKLENPTIKYVIEALQKSYLTKTAADTYDYGYINDKHELQVTTVLKLLELTVEDLLE